MLAGEGTELTEQVDVVLASLAQKYKGIERESLVKVAEAKAKAEVREGGPKKKKIKKEKMGDAKVG